VFICAKLFSTEYLNQLGSIEGSFIAISRYTVDHFGDLKWWPLWFCGMPYHDVYGPVLHNLVALVAVVLKISPALAFHKTVALFYCLGPVTLLWMVYRLSGSLACGLWSGLLYSLISPAAILIPAIRNDVGGMWHLRRLYNLVVYGESPHIASLALMPLVLIALDAAIRRGRPVHYALSAIMLAALALTNVTGLVGCAMVLAAYILAMPQAHSLWSMLRIALIALLAYGLAIPWLPPSTIRLIIANSQRSQGSYYPFRFVPFVLAAAVAATLYVVCTRLRLNAFLRFALLLTFIAAVITLPSFLGKIAIVPQPERFQLELEMGCCLAAGFALSKLPKVAPATILAALCLVALVHNRNFASRLIQPLDVRNTVEYREAKWFDQNMSGRRVFAPGSVSFWVNVFTDTPQLGGCCDQGVPNWQQRVALHTIYTGQNLGPRDGEISLQWLEAYGVHAIGVSGAGSREWYKPFGNPNKFEGLLPALWRDGGDVIYGVPQRSESLAHVIHESEVVSREPVDGSDVAPLRPYVAALNDPNMPLASMRWTSQSSATIAADLGAGDVLSVQVTYEPGWHALVSGSGRRIESDALGMMVIHPGCTGRCTVEIFYDGGSEMRIATIARLISLTVWLLLLLGPAWARIRTTYR
jgi:hypothetical protein